MCSTGEAATTDVNRPGRNRTCNPRFWSPLLATPTLQRLLIFKDLALGQQRRRCWTTPALTLILALPQAGPADRRGAARSQSVPSSAGNASALEPRGDERGRVTVDGPIPTGFRRAAVACKIK
jgi:hypothetical protein